MGGAAQGQSPVNVAPPYGTIWNVLKQGLVVPFLGAGASLAGRDPKSAWDPKKPGFLPKSAELADFLATETQFPSDDSHDREDLAKVTSYYTDANGRPILRGRLRELLNHCYCVGRLHQFLAAVPANIVLVTTNYDGLIEQAFQEAKKEYDVVIYPTDCPKFKNSVLLSEPPHQEPKFVRPNTLDLDLTKRSVIFKMHGTLMSLEDRKELDSFVITEEDYVEFLSRMTRNAAIPPWFIEHFRQRSFLFLGYGLRDWNLRVILNNLHTYISTGQAGKSWAIQYGPSILEQRLWSSRDVNIYDMTLDAFAMTMWTISGMPMPTAG